MKWCMQCIYTIVASYDMFIIQKSSIIAMLQSDWDDRMVVQRRSCNRSTWLHWWNCFTYMLVVWVINILEFSLSILYAVVEIYHEQKRDAFLRGCAGCSYYSFSMNERFMIINRFSIWLLHHTGMNHWPHHPLWGIIWETDLTFAQPNWVPNARKLWSWPRHSIKLCEFELDNFIIPAIIEQRLIIDLLSALSARFWVFTRSGPHSLMR